MKKRSRQMLLFPPIYAPGDPAYIMRKRNGAHFRRMYQLYKKLVKPAVGGPGLGKNK